MIVLAAAINLTMVIIVITSFGILYFEMLLRFKANATVTAWVGALNMALSGLICKCRNTDIHIKRMYTIYRYLLCPVQHMHTNILLYLHCFLMYAYRLPKDNRIWCMHVGHISKIGYRPCLLMCKEICLCVD